MNCIHLFRDYRLHTCFNNNKTYQEIADETHASTATISRVNRCINYGEKGYKDVLNNLPDDAGKKN